MDYDEVGRHILIDTRSMAKTARFSPTSARNGFNYTFDRSTGSFSGDPVRVDGDLDQSIDPRRANRSDYDPLRTATYAARSQKILTGAKSSGAVRRAGRQLSGRRPTAGTSSCTSPSLKGCTNITRDQTRHVKGKFDGAISATTGGFRAAYHGPIRRPGELKQRR